MNLLGLFFRRRPPRDPELAALESRIGYRFSNPDLLRTSLRHRSILGQGDHESRISNERLEFLGDAVLDLCVADHLYRQFSTSTEGELTQFKSVIVSGGYLVGRARSIGLGEFLLLSDSETRTGGRDRASILEDAYEALIGAIYLDGGIDQARRFIRERILTDLDLESVLDRNQNYKSQLLELSQRRNHGTPVYRVVDEIGPDHSKFFVVEVLMADRVLGKGTGSSKKRAEQDAARVAIELLGRRGGAAGSTDPA
jgi:ribonuclease-3